MMAHVIQWSEEWERETLFTRAFRCQIIDGYLITLSCGWGRVLIVSPFFYNHLPLSSLPSYGPSIYIPLSMERERQDQLSMMTHIQILTTLHVGKSILLGWGAISSRLEVDLWENENSLVIKEWNAINFQSILGRRITSNWSN